MDGLINIDSCELLSDFVYSFFEHNVKKASFLSSGVVNCFQILYIRSLNTMPSACYLADDVL